MTAKSSRTIPFVVLALVIGMIVGEEFCNCDITTHLENPAVMSLLGAFGLGGAAKSAVGKAVAARRAIPKEIEDAVTARVREVVAPTRTPADIDAEVDARVRAELRRRGVVDPNGKPEGGF